MISINAYAEELQIGQVWEYKTRPGETGSTLTIVKIDEIEGKRIISVSIEGLTIQNKQAPKGYSEKVSHIPILESALKASLIKMLRVTDKLPDFQEGYDHWKKAFDKKEAGYFKIQISECIAGMEETINKE